MENNKITLDKEKETLFIPLYGKAIESKVKLPILVDTKAIEIVKKINYDFNSLKIPAKTNKMMCLRAKLFDNFTTTFLNTRNETLVLHLGCGLDSRYYRINNTAVDWYDVDFEEVIDVRRTFYTESEKYHLIASSVIKPEWIEKIPTEYENNLVIAEGLFMYLQEKEINTLLHRIKKRIGNYTLVFDTYSVFTSRNVKHHPSIKKTGATIQWGIDNIKELEHWNPEFKFKNEIIFTANEEIEKMEWKSKFVYKLANLFPMARNAQKILIYTM